MFCIQDNCIQGWQIVLGLVAILAVIVVAMRWRSNKETNSPESNIDDNKLYVGKKILYGTDQGCTCHLVVISFGKDFDIDDEFDVVGQFLVTIPAGANVVWKSFNWALDEIDVEYKMPGQERIKVHFDVFEPPSELDECWVYTNNGLIVETAGES